MKARVCVARLERRDGSTWARWVCSCGRRSKLFGYPGHAERAGRQHAEARGGYLWGSR